MEIKNTKVCHISSAPCMHVPMSITTSPQTGQKRVLFDAVKDGQNVSPKWVPPEEEQEPNESRRCVVSIISVASVLKKLHCAGYGLNSQMPF